MQRGNFSVLFFAVGLLAATATQAQAFTFAPPVDLLTGYGPVDAAVADIDGDGLPDIVVTIYSGGYGNTVSVFRNTSSGSLISFAPNLDFGVGRGPEGVGIADLDGDGKPDLVTCNADDNTITVLRNTSNPGMVSFQRSDFYGGPTPHRVAIGDIDGDDNLDLAVTNNAGVAVSVFRNTSSPGMISLAAPVVLPTASYPNELALADMDGDGKLDVVLVISVPHYKHRLNLPQHKQHGGDIVRCQSGFSRRSYVRLYCGRGPRR